VRVLLDTHALLWWLTDNSRLSYIAEAAITNPANDVFVSACIGYEIAHKQRLGRLPALPESLSRRLRREAIETLPISLDHALAAAALPGPHRDPWDRIMMAQALAEQCHVVTIDKVFSEYRIPVVW
jgi:PIN domain nuclease of toxin-antitoxin system